MIFFSSRSATPVEIDLVLVIALFSAICGWFLINSDLLPYVFDNNESFSAFIHGSNLYHFGLSESFGLTDEAYGPEQAAHPYVYTHQGNLPRLFAFLMYALGLKTVESQILISTFTVGLGSILLAWLFFFRLAGRAVANFTVLLLMTEYILMTQWLWNSFKVWHGFLLFAMLVVIQSYASDQRQRWLWLLVVIASCVGYFDLLMGVFTFVVSAVFAIFTLRNNYKSTLLRVLTVMIIGGLVSILIFLSQLIAYYGFAGLKQDLMLTFTSRNFADAQHSDQAREFFRSHRIVFWEAWIDSSSVANLSAMVRGLFQYGLGVFTPYFGFLMWAVLLPPLIGSMSLSTANENPRTNLLLQAVGTLTCALAIVFVSDFSFGSHGKWFGASYALSWLFLLFGSKRACLYSLKRLFGAALTRRSVRGFRTLAMFQFITAANLLVLSICFTNRIEGEIASMWQGFKILGGGPDSLIITANAMATLLMLLIKRKSVPTYQPIRLMAAASCLLLLSALVIGGTNFLYDYADSPMEAVWGYVLAPWIYSGSTKFFSILAVALSIRIWFFDEKLSSKCLILLRRLAPFLAAILVGYAAAYAFSPGYMVFLTLKRYNPLLVFLIVPAAAAMFAVLWQAIAGAHQKVTFSLMVPLAASLLLIHATLFWIGRQWAYYSLMPPDGASGYALLSKEPFLGSNFVVGTYGAPVAAMTGGWAYIYNLFIATGAYEADDYGYRPYGSDAYKWFADRDSLKYSTPDFAMCNGLAGFRSAANVIELLKQNPKYLKKPADIYKPSIDEVAYRSLNVDPMGCSTAFLNGKLLERSMPGQPHLKLFDRDKSLLHRWSIVKLENDFPPILSLSLDQKSRPIDLTLRRLSAGECQLKIEYAFRQQQGKAEADSSMEAWLEVSTKSGEVRKTELYKGLAKGFLTLPSIAEGKVSVSLTPRTNTRTGSTYKSEPIDVRGCQ